MKRYLYIFILVLFGLSACTLLFPAQQNASIVKVEYQDPAILSVLLRFADESYFITVNGDPYDCETLADQPDILKCTGPGFEPGEEATLRIYQDDKSTKPLTSLTFSVPEYDPEQVDSDQDGLSDALDGCPGNPEKAEPGQCGCGYPDTDSDQDGVANCNDAFPNDPERTEESASDVNPQSDDTKDTDNDGIPDSEDQCPEDPDKNEPEVCGCGAADLDEDQDGITDCEDQCPGIAYSDLVGDPCDRDEDNDGVLDGADQCPYDPGKYTAGACGCGNPDYDSDGDGTADCIDGCPADANKIEPGVCGCGVKDKDIDKDGIIDCKDPYTCPESEFDCVGDPCNHDEDADGCEDCDDLCPFDPLKFEPKICGCGVVEDLGDDDGDGVKNCLDECPSEHGGTNPNGCPTK